jgi:[ribosomal protein S18]-alanine N-acetyltransferase
MIFREYKIDDRERCMEMFRSNMPLFFDPVELPDFEKWLDGQEERRLAYGNTQHEQYFVAEKDQRLVACGGYYISGEKKEARLTWGMVDNELHRTGIGSQFLRYRLETIHKAFPECAIAMDTTQHSWPFFEKMGFQLLKITEDAYAPGMHRYDLIFP